MNAIKKVMQEKQLASYYVLAFVISSLLWLPLVFTNATGASSSSPLWWLHYIGGVGPAVAAIIVSWTVGGKHELNKLLGKLRWTKEQSGWIVLGALLPIILLLVVVMAVGIGNGTLIHLPDVARTDKLPGIDLLGILLFELVFFGFGEEIGWRGFAWPRLRKKFGLLMSSFILTLPWIVWHTMTFFYNDNMLNLGIGGTLGWAFSLLTGAVILGWLTDRAKGNILPVVLFHGILDVVFVSKAVAGIYDSYLGAAIMLCSAVLVILSLTQTRIYKKL
ncbi:MAG: CPBP family intramembrane glutamic endopeptidase [Candidatus Saccharimonas sp.]